MLLPPLLRQRNFSLLWFAGLISLTGDWLLRIAMPIYVLTLTGSPAATAGVVAANLVPSLCFGFLAGVYVDRWDRRTVMIVVNLAQAVALVPLVFVHSAAAVPLVYLVVFGQASLSEFFQPAEASMLPRLVGEEDRVAANSLSALNGNLSRLIGPVVGAFAAALLGLAGAALLDAATFLVAALLIALMSGSYRAVEDHPRTGVRSELLAGFRLTAGNRVLLVLLGMVTITSFGEGIMGSTFAVFVQRELHGGAGTIGALMSAQAVGGILGGLLGARLGNRFPPVRLLVVGFVLFGAVDLVIFNLPRVSDALWAQVGLFVLVGVPGLIANVGIMTLLQREVPDAFMGRFFASAGVVISLSTLGGAWLAGASTDALGVVNLLTIQGAGYVVAAVVVGALLRGRRGALSLVG